MRDTTTEQGAWDAIGDVTVDQYRYPTRRAYWAAWDAAYDVWHGVATPAQREHRLARLGNVA